MKKLKLADNLSIPIDVITQRVSILGRTGSGKSHTAGVLAEEALKAHQQVVILDPKGDWWGLRSSADGKAAGLHIHVMGGEHGDIPLEPTAGALVADIVVNEGISVVLDLSLFESKAQEVRFAEAFLDRLYRKNRRPMLLIVDESDIFAPQKPEKNETTMLNRMETICRRGRSKGIGVVLITQRSASLHKGCLSQTELMIAHQTTAPQDKKAVEYWVVDHGDDDQCASFMTKIPKLAIGTAIVWSPSWLNIYKEVQIREKETYDSSATPRVGARRKAPKVLAQVDLERLKSHMAATIEKMKQEDPKLLRLEIGKLQAALKAAQSPQIFAQKIDPKALRLEMEKLRSANRVAILPAKIQTIEKPAVSASLLRTLEQSLALAKKLQVKYEGSTKAFGAAAADLEEALRIANVMRKNVTTIQNSPAPAVRKPAPNRVEGVWTPPPMKASSIPVGPKTNGESDAGTVVAGERKILEAIITLAKPLSRAQLGLFAGIKPTGTSMDTYLSRLKKRGYLVKEGDEFNITQDGVAFIGVIGQPMSNAEVQGVWLEKFDKGPRTILKMAIEAYPDGVLLSEAAQAMNINPKGTSMETYLSKLRSNKLIVTSPTHGGDKKIIASHELFPVQATA